MDGRRRWGLARVRGRSMTPALRPGDRLLVRYGVRPRVGEVVVADFPDGVVVVKRAAREETHVSGGGGWFLTSDNRTAPGVIDSHERGPVPVGDVLGVVRARVWPRPGRVRRTGV
jgi:phage repressor protein C with HTH and peptisase S24 domain